MRHPLIATLKTELWAMEPQACEAFLEKIEKIDAAGLEAAAASLRAQPQAEEEERGYDLRDGVAHVPIRGVMLKSVPRYYAWFGIEATGSSDTAKAVARAVRDPEARSIVLSISSPGGSIAGLQELADQVARAKTQKPVVAMASDQMASAAYWVGSQATRVLANETARVGSIGVYSVITDSSRAAKERGFDVHVVRSARGKGAGVPGAPVTTEQLLNEQDVIDRMGALFTSAVARGRGISIDAAEKLATGRDWIAGDAKTHGLIDGIESEAGAHDMARGLGEPTPIALSEAVADHARLELALAATTDLAGSSPAEQPATGDAGAQQEADMPIDPKSGTPAAGAPAVEEKKDEASALRAQLEQANARAAAAEARAEALAAAQAELRTAQITALIDQAVGAGHLTPALKPKVEKYAQALLTAGGKAEDVAKEVSGLIDQLGSTAAIRRTSEGSEDGQDRRPDAPGAQKTKGNVAGLTASDIECCAWLGISQDLFAKANGIGADGRAHIPTITGDRFAMVPKANGKFDKIKLKELLGPQTLHGLKELWGEVSDADKLSAA